MSLWVRRAAAAIAWRLRCQWAVLTARRQNRGALAQPPPLRVLVVCYGNIYRSPYAAALLSKQLSPVMKIRSTGFHPAIGRSSPPPHVEASLLDGVDLRSHRSASTTADDIAWAERIVLMDRQNWLALRRLGADPRKLIWLGALDGEPELADPYGRPPAEARRLMRRLHRCTEALAARWLAGQASTPG